MVVAVVNHYQLRVHVHLTILPVPQPHIMPLRSLCATSTNLYSVLRKSFDLNRSLHISFGVTLAL